MNLMKKRLLTIGHSYVVALNRSVMREIQKRGNIDVTVLSPEVFHAELRTHHNDPEPPGSPLRVETLPCFGSRYIHTFFYQPFALARLLDQYSFDYFYLWEEPYVFSGYQIARHLKKRGIDYSVFTAQNIFKKYPPPFSFFEKKVLNGAQSVWSCGHLVDQTLSKKGFGHLNRKVIPLFVDTEEFRPWSPAEKEAKRRELGFECGKILGFMGRFTPEKGCEVFMRTIEKMPAAKNWGALMIGSGVLENEIKDWVQRLGFQDRIKILSAKHEEVPKLLPVMDVLLCPSQTTPQWQEQFGRMLVEGFASGVAVVGSRSGEIPHVIGDAGVIVDPIDVEQWAKTSHDLLYDDEWRTALIAKGLERVPLYSVKTIAATMEQNILEALK